MTQIIPCGNEEVDRAIGGGVPFPCLMILEGGHGTGKSAMTAQFMKGILDAKKNVLCITENTVKEYIENMKSITFNFSNAFLQNRLTILPLHMYGVKWTKEQSAFLLPVIGKYIGNSFKETNCVVIDSLTLLTVFADASQILDFFTQCKYLVANGMSVIITTHPDDIPADIAQRVKGSVDCYLQLGSTNVAGKDVKTLKVIKLIGSKDASESGFAFEVDMTFGIKIVPISMANA
ncbi:flagellar accessory protein FlaH [Nitrosopumilus sp. b1]|uniref:ATPase domain-containing protein n=1 Tax=Nitrosopumilus sp. b1 TaxID=2109907 RepID=UPI000E2E1139|nr:ATPase domain-containing protein [Nitrosopumilus sp. b1]RDJ31887.1 MAG: flagellar accessory protein FlaH [Thermoproteota archaeon]KAF6243109.1 flagellar accessory protein FlaH [Nitrosopumilus sp. b1]RDJ34548.1 MAG: flagellar accessory protein FlaH [Thermoproteota archaeon]RDJ35932.1 MAG: flagellar accessory protein FlaH [Thermoproteota archaeon]RDJ38509.1 MAG: flagellar accessory protein FlaH [Thermoproteota archaeon]